MKHKFHSVAPRWLMVCILTSKCMYHFDGVTKEMHLDGNGNLLLNITIKIATEKKAGKMKNYYCVYDWTDIPQNIRGINFEVGRKWDESFALDKRGEVKLHLTVEPFGQSDANISLTSSGKRCGRDPHQHQQLLRERARQAVHVGTIQTIGHTEFYRVGQGGDPNSEIFFDAGIKDRIDNGNPDTLMPKFVAYISSLATGPFQNTDLGSINGTSYHLERRGDEFVPVAGLAENHEPKD